MDHPTQRLDPDEATATSEHPTRRLDTSAAPVRHCPKCQGATFWAEAEVTQVADRVQFRRQRSSSIVFGPQFNTTPCLTLICAECGFAEFYASQPKNLLGESC